MRPGLIASLRRLVGKKARSTEAPDDQLHIEYTPCLDGDPDPGEVVWTWVPYEEDPMQGKDRPVVIIGRREHRWIRRKRFRCTHRQHGRSRLRQR